MKCGMEKEKNIMMINYYSKVNIYMAINIKEKAICLHCLADLPRTGFANLSHNPMADRYNELIQRDQEETEPYSYAAALFYYRAGNGYSNITKSLKYRHNFSGGKVFAGMLARELAGSGLYGDVDLVIPVPLHWSRRWARGYNQAEVIAKELAGRMGARMETGLVRRARRTGTQTRLTAGERERNLSGAFRINRRASNNDPEKVRHVLLVDDVFTTGATINACRIALRRLYCPGTRISAVTLGYVAGNQ